MSKQKISRKMVLILAIAAVIIIAAVLLILLCGQNNKAADPRTITAGSIVSFGRYEQDGDDGNGRETIQWQVLAVEDEKALLLSQSVLDCSAYHGRYEEVTWEKSGLRTWLNTVFLQGAFTEEEQQLICETNVDNSPAQTWATDAAGGANTTDRIFALSVTELEKWLPEEAQRLCAATAFAKAHGVYTDRKTQANGQNAAWWWLRSPGAYADLARCADADGKVIYSEVNDATGGIRPALWVPVSALK